MTRVEPASNGPLAQARSDFRVVAGVARRRPPVLLGLDPATASLARVWSYRSMLAYELGVLWQGGASAGSLRTGADAWMRHVVGVVRIGRSVAPTSGAGRDPSRLASGQSARLAVLAVDPAGHGPRELRSGRGLGRR